MKKHWVTYEVTIKGTTYIDSGNTETEEEVLDIVRKNPLTWFYLSDGNPYSSDYSEIIDEEWEYEEEETE